MRFVLPLPPSTNNLYDRFVGADGKVHTVVSKAYKSWRKSAYELVMVQRSRQSMAHAPYDIDVWLYFADESRRRDADNFHKACQDALATVLHFDDRHVIDSHQHRRLDKAHPRCVVYLRESEAPHEPDDAGPERRGRHPDLPDRDRPHGLPAGP